MCGLIGEKKMPELFDVFGQYLFPLANLALTPLYTFYTCIVLKMSYKFAYFSNVTPLLIMLTSQTSSLEYPGRFRAQIVIAIILALLVFAGYGYVQQFAKENKTLKIEKTTGKNAKHANQKAKERAEQEYQKVNEELVKLRAKTPKTKEDVKQVDKLERLKKHWQRKKDWPSEHHSQKVKGK